MRSIFGSGLYGCVYQMRRLRKREKGEIRRRERQRERERERVQFNNISSPSNVVKFGGVPDGI